MRAKVLLVILLAGASSLGRAQTAPDTAEAGSVEAIAAATTDPRFSSPWVSYVPASSTVPSPKAYFGRIAGAAGELVNSAQAYAYCRALAAASPRVKVFTIGHSEEGRDILLLAIADERGIEELASLKAATAALAEPRTTAPEAADALIAKSAAVLLFQRSAAFGRDRLDRVGAGTRLSARRFRSAHDSPHTSRRWSFSSIRSPIRTAATSRSSGSTGISRAGPTGTRCRGSPRRTGPSTRSWTSTATRTSSRTRPPRPSAGCSSIGIPRSCTTCTRACRCS